MNDTLFVISFLLLAYTYAGYPALIWILARLFPRPVRAGTYQPRVVIIVVAYNEEARILRKLESCCSLQYPQEKLRILAVSDGSSDKTNEIVKGYRDDRVSLLAFPVRRGKAACLNDAIASCDEEIVILADVRQRIDEQAVRCLVENFADAEVGAVSGELVFETDGITQFGEGVDAYWRYEKFIRQQESRLHSTVGVTGALYALRRQSYRAIPDNTILDDVLIPMNIVMSGQRVVFDKRAKAYDLPSRDRSQEKLRKVRTLAGNYQLLLSNGRFLVPFHNPLFIQLVSHKGLRLIAPFIMAVLLGTNVILLPDGIQYQLLFTVQFLGYGFAVAGLLLPYTGRWQSVKIATAFLLLNWFAVLGLMEFLKNRQAHLWSSKQTPTHRPLT